MTKDEFMALLEQENCPDELSDHLRALWYDHRGDWHRAHEIVQAMHDAGAARIHAYLHRKEGDDWNARYWHRQAGTTIPKGMSLEDEWHDLVLNFL